MDHLSYMFPSKINLTHIIKEALNYREPKHIHDSECWYKHAGVLVPLFDKEGICKVLLTKRTNKVEHHKGQISFPGGSVDEEDASLEETALREAYEEIGLLKGDVKLLGRLDDTLTLASNFVVHPFVGLIPYPYDFRISKMEVESLLMVPLSVFNSKPRPKKQEVHFEDMTYNTVTYEYNGELIWGATARMMENFMNIIGYKLALPVGRK